MTIKQRIEFEAIPIITLAAFLGVFLAFYKNNNPPKITLFSDIPIITQEVTPTITPLPLPKITSQISPDGTKKVIMKTVYNDESSKTYVFSTADDSGDNEQTVFKKTLENTKKLAIPFNIWSPDNKYFFVTEKTTDDKTLGVFAFKALGEPFASGENYLDVTDLFKNRATGNNFKEATGWASETLIIINTTNSNSEKGPSYWFEVPSKAILQLATDF